MLSKQSGDYVWKVGMVIVKNEYKFATKRILIMMTEKESKWW